VAQGELDLKKGVAARPQRVEVPYGGTNVGLDEKGMPIEGTKVEGQDKPVTMRNFGVRDTVLKDGTTERSYFEPTDPSVVVFRENLGVKSTSGANGEFKPVTITGPNGQPIEAGFSGKTNTVTPSKLGGGAPGDTVPTADQGKANVKTATTDAARFKNIDDSMNAINSLVADSKTDPLHAYINDQALVDQFFNIVKPDTGARMNQQYINNLLQPGAIADKFWAFWQKLSNGAPLTQPDREYLAHAAGLVVDAKRPHGTAQPAKNSGGATDAIRQSLGLPPKGQ
jgi:hypothetical protein